MHAGRRSRFVCLGLLLSILLLLWYPASSWGMRAASYYNLVTSSSDPAITNLKYSSSAIGITPDGNTILSVNPDSNSLSFIDTTTLELVEEIIVGQNPRSVAVSPTAELAAVANFGSDTISVIDLNQHQHSSQIAVGDRPIAVAFSPAGQYLAVAESGDDTVRIIDSITLDTLKLFHTLDRPYSLAFSPSRNQLLVSHLLSGVLSVITYPPYSLHLPFISAISSSQHGDDLLIVQSEPPLEINFIKTIVTLPNVAPSPAVLVNPPGTRAYLPQTMANGLGRNTQFDTTVFPKVSVVDLTSLTNLTSEHISLPEVDQPVGLPWDAAIGKTGTELWVVNAASNDVSVIDISNPQSPIRVANIPVGDNPRGIVLSPDERTGFVNNTLSGTVTVLDTETYTVTKTITTTNIPLPPALLHGKRLFHSSAQPELAKAKWISCNTCHIEAEQDGRTWLLQFLGEVPPGEEPLILRNTTSLLGMVETYPLRWSAEWDESADSEFSVRFEQFGTGLIEGDMHPTLGLPNQGRSYNLDCLASYIDSLSLPARAHELSLAEQRGQVLFNRPETQCVDCHPPPLYTDLQVHDVGTADGPGEWFGPQLDTPSLRFLFDSAPYLHDGRAANLMAVLTTHNSSDLHGITTHLTDQELSELVSFLLAIPFTQPSDSTTRGEIQ